MAADRAQINFIGFDQSGQYFAYEEYGVHDGSGAAFSNIYVIDVSADKWVDGAPYTVDAIDDADPEDKTVTQVRIEAMAKAGPKLKQLKIDWAAEVIVFNGDGEHSDTRLVNFWTPNCCGPETTEDIKFTLTLTTAPIKTVPVDCQGIAADDSSIVGFSLDFTTPDGKSNVHQEGDTLPKSRGCTLDYGIYAVVGSAESGTRIAIIESWPFGFEGPDRRFIAVPLDGV